MIEKLERYAQGAFGVQAYENGNYCMYAAARAREDVLLEALKRHEWDGNTDEVCVDCLGTKKTGHSAYCVTGRVIREIEATQ